MESKNLGFCGYKRHGISITVQHMRYRKKPCLAIRIDDENCLYKVASFNSEETAQWFLDIFKEFMGDADDK